MVVFSENKIYKHKKTGVVRKVSYTYEDPKNSRLCVVFEEGEGCYATDICNEYICSTEEELKEYKKMKKQNLQKIIDSGKIVINKNGISMKVRI